MVSLHSDKTLTIKYIKESSTEEEPYNVSFVHLFLFQNQQQAIHPQWYPCKKDSISYQHYVRNLIQIYLSMKAEILIQ